MLVKDIHRLCNFLLSWLVLQHLQGEGGAPRISLSVGDAPFGFSSRFVTPPRFGPTAQPPRHHTHAAHHGASTAHQYGSALSSLDLRQPMLSSLSCSTASGMSFDPIRPDHELGGSRCVSRNPCVMWDVAGVGCASGARTFNTVRCKQALFPHPQTTPSCRFSSTGTSPEPRLSLPSSSLPDATESGAAPWQPPRLSGLGRPSRGSTDSDTGVAGPNANKSGKLGSALAAGRHDSNDGDTSDEHDDEFQDAVEDVSQLTGVNSSSMRLPLPTMTNSFGTGKGCPRP